MARERRRWHGGAWTEARERFEAALAREESPGAWEGLGWAGWWLADAELTVHARERAYRAYRACGDSGAAGRVAALLAAASTSSAVRTRWPAGGSSGPTGCSTAWRERRSRMARAARGLARPECRGRCRGSRATRPSRRRARAHLRRCRPRGRRSGARGHHPRPARTRRGGHAQPRRGLRDRRCPRRLRSGARVADLGSGTGWSSIAIARAYPEVSVDGFDVDSASVEKARANARAERLEDRVRFVVQDASDPSLGGSYELVTIFEALHDMGRPVEALANARRLLAAGGTVIVADERVADRFTAPGDDLERIMYGFSVIHCLAVGRADHDDSAATGTAMRPQTLREYARAAGFRHVEILPIENDFWRFYRLDP